MDRRTRRKVRLDLLHVVVRKRALLRWRLAAEIQAMAQHCAFFSFCRGPFVKSVLQCEDSEAGFTHRASEVGLFLFKKPNRVILKTPGAMRD
jgi:hypothetical protein